MSVMLDTSLATEMSGLALFRFCPHRLSDVNALKMLYSCLEINHLILMPYTVV